MRRIEPACVHETDSGCEVLANDRWEVGTVGKINLAAHARFDAWVGCWVEVELQVGWIFGGEQVESLDFSGCGLDFSNEVW